MPDMSLAQESSEMLDIFIRRPVKADTRYILPIEIRTTDGAVTHQEIGVRASTFAIPHHEVWDSFLPLMWVSRNGGPLFNKPVTSARVRAAFPLHSRIARFFEARAAAFGLQMHVDSPEFYRTYDVATGGEALLFGGGKDSRLLLGSLREIGHNPRIISARGAENAHDLPEALCFDPANFSMPNRIVPALMLRPRVVYQGCGLGEVHHHSPWQQYYDISAAEALRDTSELLQSLGFDITFLGPQAVLPYNLTQKILTRRYPPLAAGQISVPPHKPSDKNLHVSLLKRYHAIPTQDHCTDELFAKMLGSFMRKALDPNVAPFGHHANREVIEREMRSIILHLFRQGQLDLPTHLTPPAHWHAPWIDFVHTYCNPDLPAGLLAIYRQYADVWPANAQGLPDCLSTLCRPQYPSPYWSHSTTIAAEPSTQFSHQEPT